MNARKEFYVSRIYQGFRRRILGGRYLGNNSWPVKFFAEPLIKLLSFQKRMKLFQTDPWGTRLRFLLRWYESETLKACKKIIRPGMVVVDAGAHIGYYTRIFSELAGPEGNVLAFEPHPATFELLSFNVPPSVYPNLKLFPFALSDKRETVEFFEVKGSGKHSFYDVSALTERDPAGYELKQKLKVRAELLDDVLEELGLMGSVDFMKIDVEGAESRVLRGAEKTIRRSKNLKLVVEFNAGALSLAGVAPDDFLKQLRDLGFSQILPLEKPELSKSGYIDILCSKN